MKHIKAIDWHQFSSAAEAAKAAYDALCKDCVDAGEDPFWEVMLRDPEESKELGHTTGWHLIWECGPDSWGLAESLRVMLSGVIPPWGFCETQWGFDLIFHEEKS